MHIVNKKELKMATIITANEMARMMYEDAISAVEETMPDATQAEKDECLAAIIGALRIN